jgi:hypothetical protein
LEFRAGAVSIITGDSFRSLGGSSQAGALCVGSAERQLLEKLDATVRGDAAVGAIAPIVVLHAVKAGYLR